MPSSSNPNVKYFDESGTLHEVSSQFAANKFGLKSWTNSVISQDSSHDILIDVKMRQNIRSSAKLQASIAIQPVTIGDNQCYGLVALEPIPKGAVLVYASKKCLVATDGANAEDLYKIQIDDNELITAREYGNLARFMNHALEAKTLDAEVKFTDAQPRESVATANFSSVMQESAGQKYGILRATRDIAAGEILYWDYGLSYFERLGFEHAIFNTDGEVISTENFRWKNPVLKVRVNGEVITTNARFWSLLENDKCIILPIDGLPTDYELVLHASVIREALYANPNLAKQYFITIPIPNNNQPHPGIKNFLPHAFDLLTVCVKYINDYVTNGIVARSLLNSDFEVLGFRDSLADDSDPFARKNVAFLSYANTHAILLEMKIRLDNLEVESFIDNTDDNYTIYISRTDIFKNLPFVRASDLVPRPFDSPVRTFSIFKDNEPEDILEKRRSKATRLFL